MNGSDDLNDDVDLVEHAWEHVARQERGRLRAPIVATLSECEMDVTRVRPISAYNSRLTFDGLIRLRSELYSVMTLRKRIKVMLRTLHRG